MITCLGKSCSFDSFSLLRVSYVNVYQFVCVWASFPSGFEGGVWHLIVLIPDHCLSIYFTETLRSLFAVSNQTSSKHSTVNPLIPKLVVGWLVGCFGLNGPLKQYFSLYRAVSQREGERKEMIDDSKNVQTTPTRTYYNQN